MFPLEEPVPGHLLLNILWDQFSLSDQAPQHAATGWQSPADVPKADTLVENSETKGGEKFLVMRANGSK